MSEPRRKLGGEPRNVNGAAGADCGISARVDRGDRMYRARLFLAVSAAVVQWPGNAGANTAAEHPQGRPSAPHRRGVALEQLGTSDDFNRGIHSTLDCNPERRYIFRMNRVKLILLPA